MRRYSTILVLWAIIYVYGLAVLPPEIVITSSPSSPVVGQTVTLNGSASYDPDGTIISYSWTLPGQAFCMSGINTSIAKCKFDAAGTYTVTLTAKDNEGLYASEEYQVTITAATNTVWYVRPDGSDDNSGSVDSSSGAFRTIQTAIDSASTGDQIRVYGGIYYEQLHLKGKDVSIYSYNPANPGSWELAENTIIDANKQGTAVRYGGAESNSAELKGFTVRGGFPTGDSLALHLEFDDLNTIALDCSGKERNGIINGDPNRVAGYDGLVNGALEFNGNDRIQIEEYKGVAGKHPRSCAMWVKTSTVNTEMMLLTWGKEATSQKWQLFISSSNKLALGIWGGRLESTRTITDGNWHHVAAIFEGNGAINIRDVKLYIDGIQETTTCSNYVTTPPDINTELDGNVYVGARTGENPIYYTGVMDDVRIYSRALGDAEVKIMSQAPVSLVHLKLDGNASDASGNQHYGTVEGDPNWINSGRIYGALDLNGTGDYVTLSEGILNPAATGFSIFAWVRPDQQTLSTYQVIIQQKDVGSNYGRTLLLRTSDNKLSSSLGGSATTSSQDVFTQVGQWYHVGMTYDGQEVSLYVNGQKVASACKAAETCTGGFNIGKQKTDTNYWNGAVDDFQIYKRVLTLDEIRQIAGHQDTVAHWTMDSISGSTIADNSLYNRSGTFSVTSPTSTCSDGRLDNAISLQNNEYIRISGWNGIAGGTSRTTTAWIKTTPIPTASQMVYTWGNSANGEKWMFRVEPTGQIALGVWGGYVSGTTIVADGNWHHVAAVLNSDGTPTVGEVQLYVDGRLETVTSTNPSQAIITSNAENMLIGTRHESGSYYNYYTGGLDDIRIYDRPLSQEEIQSIAGDIGLMAHWTLNETSGPSTDSSGNGINGTWNGNPTPSAEGYHDRALEFDGTDDYVSTSYAGVLGTRNRTVSAWIKAAPDSAINTRSIVSWGSGVTGGVWNFCISTDPQYGVQGALRLGTYSSHVIGSTPINDNRWHHVAAVFENDGTPNTEDIRLYVDGRQEVLSDILPATLNTVQVDSVKIGVSGSLWFFKGKIDEVRIYDRALSDADLWQMYQASVGGGIRGYGSLAQISECIITQNKSIVDGGGFSNSTVNMDSCKIIKNISDAKGGGLYCRSGVVTNCIFSENHANTPYSEYAYGGGIHIDWSLSGVLIKDTYFIDNETMGHGGAVSTYCPVDIVNCVFYANKTIVGGGGAIAFWNSVNINSCTFTRNESQAGTIRNSSLYNSQIRNSILYGNFGGYIIYDPISTFLSSNLEVNYTVIEGGLNGSYCYGRLLTGSNNLSSNPSFVDIFSPAGPDGEFKTFDDGLCLNDSSPCIDASDDTVISAEKDITGDIRKYDDPVVANTGSGSSMADIGAYECGFRAVPDVVNLTQAQAQTQLQSVGLNVGTTFPSYSLTIPVGSVYSQNPAANSRVFKGASIAIGVVTAQAFLPAIPDGATDVGTDIVLQWLKGVGASSHLVYFGTDRDAIASAIDPNAVTTDTIYSPGQLQANTTYYWRVDEVNSFGTATGTVWSFTTGNPEVIYVNVSVEGGLGDGTSWANAFQNLQSAMDKAMPCDQIWVAGGVYSPTKQVDEEDSRSASFIPRGGVQIYGGFAGTESNLDQRIPGQNQTLLSGDIGLVGDDDDNCYHVFYYTGNNWGEIYLEGLSIVNGNASMPRGGGAVYLNASQCSIKLDHCLVYNNQGYATGAILCYGNAVIESSEFYDNISGEGNTNSFGGAAQFIGTRNTDIVQVRNCRFYSNSAGQGGALYSSVDLVLVNSIFANNYAEEAGGALLAYEGTVNITNCSMTGNQSSSGGGLYNRTATSILYNNIFWTNTADAYGEIYNYGGVVSAGYCDIENGYNGNKCFGVTNLGGNIQVNPGFDCSGVLALTSPCLDAGAANAPFIAQTDFHGNSRIMDSDDDGLAGTDIGPNEYYSQRIIYVDVNNQTGDNNGSSWNHAYRDLQDAFDHAKWGDTIYIATGIYTPTHPLSEYVSWVANSQYFGGNCFYLPTDGIVIYGGKVPYGNESETEQTVISGDIGIQGDISDNCETLLYIPNNGKRDYVLIENIVFSDAVGDAVWSSRWLPQDTKAEERNVICFGRCYFTQNHPYQNQDNSLSSVVYLSGSNPYDFMKCKFSQNKTERLLECSSGSTQSIRLNSCRFVNNKYNGSHSYNIFDVSALRIENCVFKNTGMTICISELLEDVSTVLTNNVFIKSSLYLNGSPQYNYEEEKRPIITNCTFLESPINYRNISPIVTNTILWPGSICLYPGSQEPVIPLQATYCIVPDIYAATNINTEPDIQGTFCTRSGQDMGQYNAPEIYSWGILSYYTRGTTPDIGAYEYDPSESYPPASNSMECDWQYTYHYKSYGSTGVSPTIDYDGDSLNNYHEYLNKTDPWSKDTDADGMDDKWEVDNSLNPDLDDSASDKDGDGMINSYEYQYRKELYGATGLDVTTPDETLNLDGDEFVNLIEYHFGYDPTQTTSQALAVDFKYDSYGTRYCVSMVNGLDLEYWVNKPVDTVTIKIKNTTDNDWNAAVKTITLVNQPAGKNIVEWNGRNNNNNLVNRGYYDIQITAVSDSDECVWDSSVLSRKENRCQFMYPPAIGVDKYFNIYKNQTSSISCAYNEIYGIGGLAMNIVDMNNNNAIVKQLYSGPVFYGDRFEWDGRKDDGTIFNGEFNVQIGGAFTLLPIGPILIDYIHAQPLANVHCNPYRIALVYGEVTNIGFNLDYPADITVKIYSPTDNTNPVKVFECGPLPEGYYSDLMWDGKDSNGQYVAEGIYRVEVTADFITFEQIINGTVTVYH